jgi:parallel beta-helix repeat protein
LTPASHVTVRNCDLRGGVDTGLLIYDSSDNMIINNDVTMIGRDGIRISKASQPTTGNVVKDNRVSKSMRYGILYQAPSAAQAISGAEISGNKAWNNSTGIYLVHTDRASVFGNHLHDNGRDCQGTGDCAGEWYGLAMQSCSYNLVYDNLIERSYGVGIGFYGDPTNRANGNQIYRNTITGTIAKGAGVIWQRDINAQSYPSQSVGSNNLVFGNHLAGAGWNFLVDDKGDAGASGNRFFDNVMLGLGIYPGASGPRDPSWRFE